MNEMLKDCRRGSLDMVVVWKFDRFTRSLKALISGLRSRWGTDRFRLRLTPTAI
jgi:hypothetical protein